MLRDYRVKARSPNCIFCKEARARGLFHDRDQRIIDAYDPRVYLQLFRDKNKLRKRRIEQ